MASKKRRQAKTKTSRASTARGAKKPTGTAKTKRTSARASTDEKASKAVSKKRAGKRPSGPAVKTETSAKPRRGGQARTPTTETSKPTAKKTAAKKPTAKQAAAKKPAGKEAAAKKAVAKKTAAKKPSAKQAAAKKTPEKKLATNSAAGGEMTRARASSKANGKGAGVVAVTSVTNGDASSLLAEGADAPGFELLDQDGAGVSSEQLKGKPYVLYFYPRDDTPGCTTEACGFRDHEPDFSSLSVRVLGVSPDEVGSHRRFSDKFSLNFTLLADPDKVLSQQYGAWGKKKNYGREYMGIIRSTFLIDGNGTLRKAWRGVKVPGHVDAVLEAASQLSA